MTAEVVRVQVNLSQLMHMVSGNSWPAGRLQQAPLERGAQEGDTILSMGTAEHRRQVHEDAGTHLVHKHVVKLSWKLRSL